MDHAILIISFHGVMGDFAKHQILNTNNNEATAQQ